MQDPKLKFKTMNSVRLYPLYKALLSHGSQGKSEHFDWFSLSQDFTTWTFSLEMVISHVGIVFESWEIKIRVP